MVNSSLIKKLAKEHGFDICGITPATHLQANQIAFDRWIAMGYGEPLEYINRYYDIRFDPSKLVESGKSVIVCAVSYKNQYSHGYDSPHTPKIASYALSRDYHKTIRKRLKKLLGALQNLYPNLAGRCFTDSAPLLEKQLASNAGIGWIGRQSLLISPEFGSFILLGEIVIDDNVDIYDTPYEENGCNGCHKCIDSCPVSAINNDRTIDTRRCISCRTVEIENNSKLALNGWIFGCDECQSCCPHNQITPQHNNPDFDPISTPPTTAQEWREMSEDDFIERFGQTPVKRGGLERIKRLLK